ncbi:hypothetical protein YC2023_070293 [Brassica napus]
MKLNTLKKNTRRFKDETDKHMQQPPYQVTPNIFVLSATRNILKTLNTPKQPLNHLQRVPSLSHRSHGGERCGCALSQRIGSSLCSTHKHFDKLAHRVWPNQPRTLPVRNEASSITGKGYIFLRMMCDLGIRAKWLCDCSVLVTGCGPSGSMFKTRDSTSRLVAGLLSE